MRYSGGKSKIARRIVDHLPLDVGMIWEPFMGGGAITAELCKCAPAGALILASDAFAPIISMWRAAQGGWLPPERDEPLSDDAWRAAKSLPDVDPFKAFVGFGCAFGGIYFKGPARLRRTGDSYYSEARRGLIKTAKALNRANLLIDQIDFLTVTPREGVGLIYCDPPYFGTLGYKTGPFDSELFWFLCSEWARLGWRVFVSEFTAPVDVFTDVIWRHERKINTGATKVTKCELLLEVVA